ncbi:membrane protein, putative [Babesia bigemina]|uniref:Membrane protein, putative n=1 Tax=Babesia bigemina TaxID=5866 RepID=A0A061D0X0_BABBI|nr:membrane protein, putative [Babesia bigemina]CDR94456.1 membrane protein, putative [Babesia bigemina]|eukprot:XP_012766642.1 membrane protein, putative [Babesia bigemina]
MASMLAHIFTLAGLLWFTANAQVCLRAALQLNIVLDGQVYQEKAFDDLCSVVDAADSAIVKSSLPFSSISMVPDHWAIYIDGVSLPVADCEQNDVLFQQLGVNDGAYVYLFRNETAYNDPLYAAEYLKRFTKQFGDRIRPVVKRETSSKKSTKPQNKNKKKKSGKMPMDNLSGLIGLLANAVMTGDVMRALGQSVGARNVANREEGDQGHEKGAINNMDVISVRVLALAFSSSANSNGQKRARDESADEL